MFKWRDEWAIGNELIDSQHKGLFEALNNFINACYAGKVLIKKYHKNNSAPPQNKGADIIQETMNFLLEYTVKHFADEEALQLLIRYPDYENHKKMHENFKAKAVELAEKLKEDGPNNMLVMKINSTVGEWLVSHIEREDKKIGEHLKAKQKSF